MTKLEYQIMSACFISSGWFSLLPHFAERLRKKQNTFSYVSVWQNAIGAINDSLDGMAFLFFLASKSDSSLDYLMWLVETRAFLMEHAIVNKA